MSSVLYEVKIRIKDSFIPLLKQKVDFGEAALIDETDTYLTVHSKERTEKLKESGKKHWHEVITKDGVLFHVVRNSISAQERATIMQQRRVEVVVRRHRERYAIGSVDVAIDRVDDLGTYLELQSSDRNALESLTRKLGFNSSQYVEHPYDWLKR